MKKCKILTLSVTIFTLLTSCSQRELRSDIKEFIASFSLEESVKEYKEAGFNSEKITIQNGKTEREIETLSFNVKDVKTPIYTRNLKIYNDEVLTSEVNQYIETKEEKYYFHHNEEVQEFTLEECHNLVEAFFYKQTEIDGTYHLRGYYYGDYVLQGASSLQDLVTIDQENELYIFHASQDKKADNGEIVKITQEYRVNKLGMLTFNQLDMVSESTEFHSIINVFKV